VYNKNKVFHIKALFFAFLSYFAIVSEFFFASKDNFSSEKHFSSENFYFLLTTQSFRAIMQITIEQLFNYRLKGAYYHV
jgi:hypothetical protein